MAYPWDDETSLNDILKGSAETMSQLLVVPQTESRLGKVVAVSGVAISAVSIIQTAVGLIRGKRRDKDYVITADQGSVIYNVLHNWMGEYLKADEAHTFASVFTGYIQRDSYRPGHKFVLPTLNEGISVTVPMKSGVTKIETIVGEVKSRRGGDTEPTSPGNGHSQERVVIKASSSTSKAFEEFMEELNNRTAKFVLDDSRKPKIFTANSWSEFVSKPSVPRPAESVILNSGVWESIRGQVDTFLSNEEEYNRLAMPYHLGVLLDGPPGSGKTSVTAALQSEFKMDSYHISLKAMETDNDLIDLFQLIPKNSLIVLEDIDAATNASLDREGRDSESRGITLSGLLNVLDGSLSPYGSVVIMTTNHRDKLDPAIVRAGRVDVDFHLGYTSNDQLCRMCNFYLGGIPVGLPQISEDDKISAAEITGVFRMNIHDKDKAGKDLVELLKGKVASHA